MPHADLYLNVGRIHFTACLAAKSSQLEVERHGDAVDIYLNDRIHGRGISIKASKIRLGGNLTSMDWLGHRESSEMDSALMVSNIRWLLDLERWVASIFELSG